MKYVTPANYKKMKVKDKKKSVPVNQVNNSNSDNEANKNKHSLVKLNIREPNNPKTPPSVREEISTIAKKDFSSINGGLYTDNSEYCSYITAASNSTKKVREYSNESLNNRTYNTQLND